MKGPDQKKLTHTILGCGYSLVSVPTPFGTLWVNGVYVPFLNNAMSPRVKKENRQQKVTWEALTAYSSALAIAAEEMRSQLVQNAAEAVAGLHDVKTAVGIVFRNAEAIISGLSGYDDFERIESADPALKALLKSVSLRGFSFEARQ